METIDVDNSLREFIIETLKRVYAPCSVYRLELNKEFTFRQAEKILPYLQELGIDAVYLSPYFQTLPGSLHGYNISDPNRINAEIGTQDDLNRLCAELSRLGLGQILDVVPNHMSIQGSYNRYWLDVLENGPSSIYANFFDVNWNPLKRELRDKVLLPTLGDYYGKVLENQEIQLVYVAGRFEIHYYGAHFPVNPKSYPFILKLGIDQLERELGPSQRDFMEYQSIIQAMTHLPASTERRADLVIERHREKAIAQERLKNLTDHSHAIRTRLDSVLRIFNGKKGEPRSFDLLDELLNQQSYRIAYWNVASEEINYRRFFDVNELAAIRIENESVLSLHHQLLFKLLREGRVQGLRIDHPDGLYFPSEYFRTLQQRYLAERFIQEKGDSAETRKKAQRLMQIYAREFSAQLSLFVVVEKILDWQENLPENWSVCGTVGYEYLNALNGLFIYKEAEPQKNEIYENFIGHKTNVEELIYQKKKYFALIHMASEINQLGFLLNAISEGNRQFRDLTLNSLTWAIREVIACFPVYRSYIAPDEDEVSPRDEKYIRLAIERARRRTPTMSPAVYDFLRDILLLKLEKTGSAEFRQLCRNFVLRFQQLSSPIMAKGLEDTVFYIYNAFLSLNEVGGNPSHFGHTAEEFHRQNFERRRRWPQSFIATSTHDTKRNEDVRMRLNVLSEILPEWKLNVDTWSGLNQKHKSLVGDLLQPQKNAEYFIYQTLVGVWPLEELNAKTYPLFIERMLTYFQKAGREAKTFTHWISPDLEYEAALEQFIRQILEGYEENLFLRYFLPFQRMVARFGMLNALSALAIKNSSPGVLDTYQGNEVWHYTLVDPDNRRPVDYARRRQLLESLTIAPEKSRVECVKEWMNHMEDGRIKLYSLSRQLQYRKKYKELFLSGDYVPLAVEGVKANHVVAFLRTFEGHAVLTAATRYYTQLLPRSGGWRVSSETWGDTAVVLPGNVGEFTDLFTEETLRPQGGKILAKDLFQTLPWSVRSNRL